MIENRRGRNSLCCITPKYNYNYLYVLEANNAIKIGISIEPEKRIKELQTGNPCRIKLLDCKRIDNDIATRKLEKILHSIFHKYKFDKSLEKSEWFTKDVLDYLLPLDDKLYDIIDMCLKANTVKSLDSILEERI